MMLLAWFDDIADLNMVYGLTLHVLLYWLILIFQISLLQSKEHLFKELNYHNPQMATQLRGKSLDDAVHFWRNNLVESGIKNAMRITESSRKASDMTRRLATDPEDAEAKEYFSAKDRRNKVQEQYEQMTNE